MMDMGPKVVTQVFPFVEERDNSVNLMINIFDKEQTIEISINSNRAFESMFWRKEVIGAMNKIMDGLVQQHLDLKMKEQAQLEEDK